MTTTIIIQSLNNKTVDIINASDFSKITINSNNATVIPYDNMILNIHSNINSITISNFWNNLTAINRDAITVIFLIASLSILFIISKLIKIQSK